MAITEKQRELDKAKWFKSEQLGYDACGTFDYCEYCDMCLENPCEKALIKLTDATKPAKKTATKKKSAAKKTVTKEKSATKKAAASKSATSKTTKKAVVKKTTAKKSAK